jgi:Flp pilus assembly protein TadG
MNRSTTRITARSVLRARLNRGDRGAALVEFTIVMLLLITLLFGIMEAGWAFSQSVEIRNAAREGGRIAVVDYGDATAIGNEVCNRAGLTGAGTQVTITRLPAGGPYESIEVSISKGYETLTGFLPVFEGLTLSSTVEMRLERELVNLVSDATVTCT